mmetsp:Transcript_96372/g.272484  ORF Transcript_96372/g.272484 Transcript_96372/m.272484 type:complete len:226 (+) Transcript_96372:81-758(+)
MGKLRLPANAAMLSLRKDQIGHQPLLAVRRAQSSQVTPHTQCGLGVRSQGKRMVMSTPKCECSKANMLTHPAESISAMGRAWVQTKDRRICSGLRLCQCSRPTAVRPMPSLRAMPIARYPMPFSTPSSPCRQNSWKERGWPQRRNCKCTINWRGAANSTSSRTIRLPTMACCTASLLGLSMSPSSSPWCQSMKIWWPLSAASMRRITRKTAQFRLPNSTTQRIIS